MYSICLHSRFAGYFGQWPKNTMYTFLRLCSTSLCIGYEDLCISYKYTVTCSKVGSFKSIFAYSWICGINLSYYGEIILCMCGNATTILKIVMKLALCQIWLYLCNTSTMPGYKVYPVSRLMLVKLAQQCFGLIRACLQGSSAMHRRYLDSPNVKDQFKSLLNPRACLLAWQQKESGVWPPTLFLGLCMENSTFRVVICCWPLSSDLGLLSVLFTAALIVAQR